MATTVRNVGPIGPLSIPSEGVEGVPHGATVVVSDETAESLIRQGVLWQLASDPWPPATPDDDTAEAPASAPAKVKG